MNVLLGHNAESDIVVHYFTHAEPSWPGSSQDILQLGSNLVSTASQGEIWHQPATISSEITFDVRGPCYVYSQGVPKLSDINKHLGSSDERNDLREWDYATDASDRTSVVATQDLDEFEHTDLDHIFWESLRHDESHSTQHAQAVPGSFVGVLPSYSLLGSPFGMGQGCEQVTVHHFDYQDSAALSSQYIASNGIRLTRTASGGVDWFTPDDPFDLSSFDNQRNAHVFSQEPPKLLHPENLSTLAKSAMLRDWADDLYETLLETGSDTFELKDLEDFEHTDIVLTRSMTVEPRHSPHGFKHCDVELTKRCILEPQHSPQHINAAVDTTFATRGELIVGKVHGRSANEAPIDGEPARKRPRCDATSLYKVIPEPHFHSSPSDAHGSCLLNPPPMLYKIPKHIPIPPHSAQTVTDFLCDPFIRGSWIVPVRGRLLWDGCTPATMLASDPGSQERSHSGVFKGLVVLPSGPSRKVDHVNSSTIDEINWTHDALLDFWWFLLSLREACTLGPISLSFHAAPVHRTRISSRDAHQPGHAPESGSTAYGGTVTSDSGMYRAAALSAVDHIKVYHDVQHTMKIRNVLSAWWYKWPNESSYGKDESRETAEDEIAQSSIRAPTRDEDATCGEGSLGGNPTGKSSKIHILKRAKLALIDERSNGVLIS
ncbi:uncharacterized protein FIBRA_08391 [Fibroporia radiculosa]|uniref:Uncharacterized protein n=1 Tax=Fibroporia radiculosa TaxID=599839 RepID=J4ICB9_9APHY|nr:uncharacterized protein FIBRA_08391 [Fibroporia radiculosa]CCM06141.1 predicted protein [Fibroporia radiculosa]